jgi:hypothetical protein
MMTVTDTFSLTILLEHLSRLDPETVEDLPFPELEWALSDFVLSWGQRLSLSPTNWPSEAQRVGLPDFLPFNAASDFPAVHPGQVRTLALATTCSNLYVLLLDHIVDEPLTAPAAAKLAIQHVLLHFYRLLSQLFTADSPFWSEVERLMGLMSRAMLDEHQMHGGTVHPFSLDEFKRIARGKMACVQINCVALAMLNGTPERIPALAECWDALGLAAIIRDDCLDWQEDYRNANYTYLLSQVLLSPPFRTKVEAGHLPEPAEVGAALFCTDLIESLYMLAYAELGAAACRATEISCPALASLLRELQVKMGSRSTEMFDRKMAALIAMTTSDF